MAAITGNWLVTALETNKTADEAAQVTSAVIDVIVNDPRRRFEVVERINPKAILDEKGADIEGAKDLKSAAIKLGQITGARYVILGSCGSGVGGSDITIGMRLVKVDSDAKVVAARSGVCEPCTTQRLQDIAKSLVRQLINVWPHMEVPGGFLPGMK